MKYNKTVVFLLHDSEVSKVLFERDFKGRVGELIGIKAMEMGNPSIQVLDSF